MANKITAGNPGPGRPKGSPNKVTKAAKDAIADAAERLGGSNRLVEWAKEDPKNEHAFWATIYPKLLPLQVNGPGPEGEHYHALALSLKDAPDEVVAYLAKQR